MAESLYERLGATEGIIAFANDLVENHYSNPIISKRFEAVSKEGLKKAAAEFVISGTGGPNVYTGKDMIGTHKGLNINGDEFVALLDDAMRALESSNVGQREREEVIYILVSFRAEVMAQ